MAVAYEADPHSDPDRVTWTHKCAPDARIILAVSVDKRHVHRLRDDMSQDLSICPTCSPKGEQT